MQFQLPFYIKSIDNLKDYNYPLSLPFEAYIDDKIGLLRQKENRLVIDHLELAYAEGSLFEGSLSNESGNVYYQPFVDFILRNSNTAGNILEIGCGNGALLKGLKQHFTELVGIEPAAEDLVQDNLTIYSGFFPNKKITGRFDQIIHFGVLEHIVNPSDFLVEHKKHLREKGKVIIAVPDATDSIMNGDLSMFFHEHLSYFNLESLKNIFGVNGFEVLDTERQFGMIFLSAKKSEEKYNLKPKTIDFEGKYREKLLRLESKLKKYPETKIAVYPGLRGINYLHLLNLKKVRLIDDSTELLERFVPGFEKPIEGFKGLTEKPPLVILVTSLTFKNQIVDKIQQVDSLKNCKIEFL